MATYVDLSYAPVSICVNATPDMSSGYAVQQFDFSGFSSYFSNLPALLNIEFMVWVNVGPNTVMDGNSMIQVADENPTTSGTDFNYSTNFVNQTSSSISTATGMQSYHVQPYDFNGTTTYNVWLTFSENNVSNADISGTQVCILGYWY